MASSSQNIKLVECPPASSVRTMGDVERRNRKIADNVLAFLDKAEIDHGRMMGERFRISMWQQMQGGLDSPIEDLFFIACHNVCESESVVVNPYPDDDHASPFRAFITPQAIVGKFRVDFLLKQNNLGPDALLTPVIVELDGHDFHDKDKHQRAYEKARDRFLVRSGYRVLHFTGSEVVADPYKVAHEALSLIGVCPDPYDPTNPLHLE